jgi:hypothetical protein
VKFTYRLIIGTLFLVSMVSAQRIVSFGPGRTFDVNDQYWDGRFFEPFVGAVNAFVRAGSYIYIGGANITRVGRERSSLLARVRVGRERSSLPSASPGLVGSGAPSQRESRVGSAYFVDIVWGFESLCPAGNDDGKHWTTESNTSK